MAHAPLIYGWWSLPQMTQAHVLLAETLLLFFGYVALAVWGLSLHRLGPVGDPAERMMAGDDGQEDGG